MNYPWSSEVRVFLTYLCLFSMCWCMEHVQPPFTTAHDQCCHSHKDFTPLRYVRNLHLEQLLYVVSPLIASLFGYKCM